MKPNSLEHDMIASQTPGTDEEERGTIECPNCGTETEANRAAVAVAEQYTCPECAEKTEFNNHMGMFLLVLAAAFVFAPFYRAYQWLQSKIPL